MAPSPIVASLFALLPSLLSTFKVSQTMHLNPPTSRIEHPSLLFGHPGDQQAASRSRSRQHTCLYSFRVHQTAILGNKLLLSSTPDCDNSPSTRLCVPAIARDQPDSDVTAAFPSQTPPNKQRVRIQLPRLGNANDPLRVFAVM